jgi:DNA modification methylase
LAQVPNFISVSRWKITKQEMTVSFLGIHNIDARKISDYIHGEVIQSIITSPPYFDMKDYSSENQIGFGQTYEEYLKDLKLVFSNIYNSTKHDGTLWIIIDTIKGKEGIVPLPFDLAAKLKEIGWILQDIIIWKKDKTVPWYTNGFVQRKFEYILFFSKSENYKCHRDNVRMYDTKHLKGWWVKYPERYNPKGKALDEVWEYPIPTQGSWGNKYIKHFCPLPTDMVGNMIQLSTDEDDIVLDPFSGSGSVLVQAAYMNRQYIGFELNPGYVDMFKNYLEKTLYDGRKNYKAVQSDGSLQNDFKDLILKLRCLKYARVLYQKVGKTFKKNPIEYIIVEDMGMSEEKFKLKKVRYSLVINDDIITNELLNKIPNITSVSPLSKFGIEQIIELKNHTNDIGTNKQFYGYTATNTHHTTGEIRINRVPSNIKVVSDIRIEIIEKNFA